MKLIIDTEDGETIAALAQAIADRLNAGKDAEPAKAPDAPKPPTKPKPGKGAPKADALTQPQVQALLKEYAAKNGRDKAMAILNKYAGSVSELTDEDLPKVVAELKGESTSVDVDF